MLVSPLLLLLTHAVACGEGDPSAPATDDDRDATTNDRDDATTRDAAPEQDAAPRRDAATQDATPDGAPVVDGGVGRVRSLAVGGRHTCAILDAGAVKCWGDNEHGQLGLGDTQNRGENLDEMGDALPTVDLGRAAIAITAGEEHTCAILDDGSVRCWGRNALGQLGIEDSQDRGDAPGEMGNALRAVDLGVDRTATAIVSGLGQHTCALLDDGAVKCWGDNGEGQLGQGNTRSVGATVGEMGSSLLSIDLGAGRMATAIVAGVSHTCALLDDGAVKCWGDNGEGQLGLGSSDRNRGAAPHQMGDALPAVALGAGRTALMLGAGALHTCATLDNGALKCWGRNGDGQLGQGNTNDRGRGANDMGDHLLPIELGAERSASIVTAGNSRTCAILDTGALKCWGSNSDGELGLGDRLPRGITPSHMGNGLRTVDLGSGRRAIAVAAGFSHTCAILDDSTLKCWGGNYYGQLGLGEINRVRGDEAGEMGDDLPTVDLGE